jgi:SlyX protein
MNQERLIEIETILAHQEKQIQDLSEVISRQWQEIDRLKIQLDRAYARMESMEQGENETKPQSVTEEAAANKPPHY